MGHKTILEVERPLIAHPSLTEIERQHQTAIGRIPLLSPRHWHHINPFGEYVVYNPIDLRIQQSNHPVKKIFEIVKFAPELILVNPDDPNETILNGITDRGQDAKVVINHYKDTSCLGSLIIKNN